MTMMQFIYLSIHQQINICVVPIFWPLKQSCYGHSRALLGVDTFRFSWLNPWQTMAGPHGSVCLAPCLHLRSDPEGL